MESPTLKPARLYCSGPPSHKSILNSPSDSAVRHAARVIKVETGVEE